MEDDNREVQIQPVKIKLEFPSGNDCEADVENMDHPYLGPHLEISETEVETKPSLPLYNLYPMNIKEEVNDADPPFFSLTSVVKAEFHPGQLNAQYFNHSTIILQNLKTEPEDEDEYFEDPLSGADSMPLGHTQETSFQVLGQCPSEKIQTGEESDRGRLSKQSYPGKGEVEREKTCEKCLMGASKPNEHKIGPTPTGDRKKHYKCETCGKGLASRSEVTNHMSTYIVEKLFECATCGKCFAHSSSLARHKRSHSGYSRKKPFECETCGKCFADSSSLITHKRCHSGEKPIKCETCGKCFAQTSQLTVHKRSHSGEKPFECETCGKSFAECSKLTRHKMIHTGDKPFKCEMCGKSFAQSSYLITHRKLHCGERLIPM